MCCIARYGTVSRSQRGFKLGKLGPSAGIHSVNSTWARLKHIHETNNLVCRRRPGGMKALSRLRSVGRNCLEMTTKLRGSPFANVNMHRTYLLMAFDSARCKPRFKLNYPRKTVAIRRWPAFFRPKQVLPAEGATVEYDGMSSRCSALTSAQRQIRFTAPKTDKKSLLPAASIRVTPLISDEKISPSGAKPPP